ncbi:MAG: hypothetical protein ACT4QC_10640 [Planctomycetaceae bacterium]
MRTINRIVAIARPKQPYFDWANALAPPGLTQHVVVRSGLAPQA